MNNYLKITIFVFAIIPFSIIYFLSLFGLYDLLSEFIEKLLIFVAIIGGVVTGAILILGICCKVGTKLIDSLMSRSYEYESPTPQGELENSEARGAIEAKSSDIQSESRGFDWSKQKQGSPEAAAAYKQSSEHRENEEKLRTLDELLAAARGEVKA